MNKREQGAEYLKGVLNLLARVGYASTRQVAKGVWGRCDISTRKMAGRTLRRLLDGGLIVSKRDSNSIIKVNNELLFALTATGVQEVRRHGTLAVAEKVHARDYLRHAHDHRTVCNSVFVALPNEATWSEFEVRAKVPRLHEFEYELEGESFRKIPDLIAVTPDNRWEWIEVENSWRNEKDLLKVRACMRVMFWNEFHIGCVHFVVTAPVARTIGNRLATLMTHPLGSGAPRQIKELDARILANHLKFSYLDAESLTLSPIAWVPTEN